MPQSDERIENLLNFDLYWCAESPPNNSRDLERHIFAISFNPKYTSGFLFSKTEPCDLVTNGKMQKTIITLTIIT
jgi:hypothetical protein